MKSSNILGLVIFLFCGGFIGCKNGSESIPTSGGGDIPPIIIPSPTELNGVWNGNTIQGGAIVLEIAANKVVGFRFTGTVTSGGCSQTFNNLAFEFESPITNGSFSGNPSGAIINGRFSSVNSGDGTIVVHSNSCSVDQSFTWNVTPTGSPVVRSLSVTGNSDDFLNNLISFQIDYSTPTGRSVDGNGFRFDSYPYGTSITLTPTPLNSGTGFQSWAGGYCSGAGPCTIVLTSMSTTMIRGNFTWIGPDLTLTIPDSKVINVQYAGTFSSIPGPQTTTIPILSGTVVTLTSTNVIDWGKSGCSAPAACVFTMASDLSLSPTFN